MEQSPLLQMAIGYIPAQTLHVTVELGLADALADGPHTYENLAKQTGTDPRTLRRLLRALVGLGLVTQLDPAHFELTELGEQLRTDTPGSLRDEVLLCTAPVLWRAWSQLPRIVRTGEPARQPDTGWTPFEWLLQDSELSVKFHEAMAQSTRALAPGIAEAYDFTSFRTVADIGGGYGMLITGLLTAVPGLRAILYDLPTAVQTAPAALRAAGVGHRCEIISGNFFESVPSGADAYILNNVLRNWDDEKATAILRNCRAAMTPNARVLIVETVLPPVITPDGSMSYGMTDLNMLVYAGGAERTADEYRDLLGDAGFALTTITDVMANGKKSGLQVIEGMPTA